MSASDYTEHIARISYGKDSGSAGERCGGVGGRKMANEKRLIDANAFFDRLKKQAELMRQGKIGEIDINLLIASTPTVDAVEVVRCKDCKHSRPTEWYRAKLKCCHSSHGCSQVPYEVPKEHFCSYGERKDNERKTD